MERLGAFAFARRWQVLGVALLLLLGSLGVILRGGRLTTGAIAGMESGAADLAQRRITGATEDVTMVLVMSSATLDPRDAAFTEARDAALAPLRADPHVLRVLTVDDAPPAVRPMMQNGSARRETAFVALRGDFKEAAAAYPAVRAKLSSPSLLIECTGRVPYMHDLDVVLGKDLLLAEAVSLPFAALLLLYVFRTWVLALVPVVSGALAVTVAIGMVTALSYFVDVASYTVNVMSLVGLGVAIDYSLFMVSRYREELEAGRAMREALMRTASTAGRAVLFSGFAVCVGLSGLAFFRGSYLLMMGVGGALVVLVAMLSALVFVPALLAVLGQRIFRGKIRAGGDAGALRWERLARAVMRRPWLVLVPTVLVLVLAARPFARLRMSAADVRVLDERSEARRAYDTLARDFPAQAATRANVVVHFPGAPALTGPRIHALYNLSRSIAKLPHVTRVESIVDGPSTDPDDDYGADTYEENLLRPSPLLAPIVESGKKLTVGDTDTVLYVRIAAPPDSEEARRVVLSLREHRDVADGLLMVGGATANDVDTTTYMLERAPRAVGFIVLVTALALFAQLRSVLLPLKAILMNILSIGASFGALVWVFQDGRLFVHEGRPLEPTLPVLLFAVIFGLSMDYEVLILARIREEYDAHGDSDAAVAKGLAKTAGLVTSAAAIMVTVFAAFALARVVLVQATGFGMALAVLVDATLVRVLLVPATMKLLGKWNFWSPFSRRKQR
jgi:RND superfamily putative drug exporter